LKENRWVYKSTVKRRFGLTENQIRIAIEKGLVKARQIRNPHYTSGPPSTLLLREDVEAHLDEIKTFPTLSEEEKRRRRIYGQRSRLRRKLEFYCPRCQREIRALRGSAMFEECFRGGVSVLKRLNGCL